MHLQSVFCPNGCDLLGEEALNSCFLASEGWMALFAALLGCGERLLDTPSELVDAHSQSIWRDANLMRPIRQALGDSVVRENYCMAWPVSVLLCLSNPAAISRLVVLARVDTVQRHFLAGTIAHIR